MRRCMPAVIRRAATAGGGDAGPSPPPPDDASGLDPASRALVERIQAVGDDRIRVTRDPGGWWLVDITLPPPPKPTIATQERIENLVAILDGYFKQGGQHINVNVLNRETLLDAMERPHLYPGLTVRVSGYAVHFSRLTREQQLEIIARTFHDNM